MKPVADALRSWCQSWHEMIGRYPVTLTVDWRHYSRVLEARDRYPDLPPYVNLDDVVT